MSYSDDELRRLGEELGIPSEMVESINKALDSGSMVLPETKAFVNTGPLPAIHDDVRDAGTRRNEGGLTGDAANLGIDEVIRLIDDAGYTDAEVLAAYGIVSSEMRDLVGQTIEALKRWTERDPAVAMATVNLSHALSHAHNNLTVMAAAVAAIIRKHTGVNFNDVNEVDTDIVYGVRQRPPYSDDGKRVPDSREPTFEATLGDNFG